MRRILQVSSIMFDPKDRHFHGTVVVAEPLGVFTRGVSAPGHPAWDQKQIFKAIEQQLAS